jgi:hypothetical protein
LLYVIISFFSKKKRKEHLIMSFGAMFRRKHSELKGELSNLYNHEEKLLSEVCYYMASVL